VLITAGGLRPDHLAVYGYDDPAISPNIDALAWRGLRFEQAFAPASWSEPSLASLMTSLYPSELGIDCWAAISCTPHLDAQRLTLAEALREAGYRTQAYVTSPWLSEELGFAQGFDGFEGVRAKDGVRVEEPFDLWPMRRRTLGRLLGCESDSAVCGFLSKAHARLFEPPIPAGWGGDQVNARVTRFLDLHGDVRFFLWVHYTEALPAYDLEPPFRPLPKGPRASSERRLKSLGYWELGDSFTPREKLLPRDVEGLTALYDAEVHRVDRLVGGLAGLLEAHGLTERTLVVFTADHGQEFMEHGGYTYGHTLYDEVLRVPLIVAGPGVASAGRSVETAVGLLDVVPTLLDAAGGAPLPEAEGRSLLPALVGGRVEERPLYAESLYRVPRDLKAVRSDGYSLICDGGGACELYDLQADPKEQRDLAVELPEVGAQLQADLREWLAHTERVARRLPRAVPRTEFTDAVW
jgi:arylsulfatase A-like enzyme